VIVRPGKQRGLGEYDPPEDYDDGRLSVRPRDYLAFADGEAIHFANRQLGMLVELYRTEPRIRSREELRTAVWGPSATVSLRSVDVVVKRVREKLDLTLPDLSYIHSFHGLGYAFYQKDFYD
jgi:DNA-binding response OmpR family regulator